MLEIVGLFTDLMIGFSVFAAAILLLAYQFLLNSMQRTAQGRISCTILLLSLCVIQLHHYGVASLEVSLFTRPTYLLALLAAPPSFYLFSRAVLLPEQPARAWEWLHFLPLGFAYVLPASFLVPVAFALGAAYSIWFAQFVWGMRRSVARYRFEQFFFGFFALMAISAFLLILAIPHVDERVFYVVYANFTGVSLWLITGTLIVFPQVIEDMSAAAQLAYTKSTLDKVDVDDCAARLEALMSEDKLYQDESLNLSAVSDALGLASHQLSELINTRFGMSFSRYIREQRVTAAKQLLVDDPKASVLSVGLSAGFRSQSNFYAAFQEVTGQSPGAWRRSKGS